LPSGLTGSSTTNSIEITGATAGTYAAGTIKVTATNDCGTSAAKSSEKAVTVCSAVPATPGTIQLSATTVGLTGTFTASVPEVTGTTAQTSYTWTLPSGLIGSSTSRTITITGATAGTYAAGTITVTATNACGTSAAQSSASAVTVHNCPGYVCSNCAFDYSSTYDDVPGDIAKGKTPTTTNTDEDWAPNVQIGHQDYITEDTKLFSAFTAANKDLCVYKADGNSGNQPMWPKAVQACNGTVDGFDDWYLPNLRELRALYDALGGNGGSTTGSSSDFAGGSAMRSLYYWSSTEGSANYAYGFSFGSGTRYYDYKASYSYVRCVRRM
jgi:hypothetical protein